ncbi:FtsX-like permease family protein [Streptomyces sp. PLK6-54]|uniref:FtsX-like permease family protein n=2 Tax=Actinacidiphila acidipaludis TaxID=2873382 RepID=A0ABS7QDU3_9ACTN|nr:FtsX-like permease family protein [Streptomyces acidipaludis]
MIALPIMGVSAADITVRSSELTKQQQVTRDIGAADARLGSGGMGHRPLVQSPVNEEALPADQKQDESEQARDEADSDVDPRTAIPAGARWITDQSTYARIRTRSGLLDTSVRELKADDPIAAGIVDLDRGRFPRSPDEMIATQALLKSSGLHVDSLVRVRGFDRAYRIVGAYDLPSELGVEELTALPGAFIAGYTSAMKAAGSAYEGQNGPPSYLVSLPGGYSWPMVMHANSLGVVVESREVRLHPPARADVPFYRVAKTSTGVVQTGVQKAETVAAPVTVGALAILEVCLLAGPAFAVGARRSRRQLGLVGANGGDRRHIRAIVLSGGLVIGVVAAVTGTLLGLALTALLRGWLEEYVGKRFGGLALRPLELAAIAGLAVLTGLLAAVVPAVNASRQSVLSSLTGRRGVRHAGRVMPVIGLGAVCLGTGIAVFGSTRTDSVMVVGLGSGVAELGVVALTPVLVGAFGRFGRWLPTAPRLALRDAVRNRGRTAPAVAAVLAAVAGSVAVATYAASQDRQDHDAYTARAPRGVYAVSSGSDGGRELGAVRAAVEKHFPVSGRADVSRLVYGPRTCEPHSYQSGCGGFELQVPTANQCPSERVDDPTQLSLAERRSFATDWRCAYGGGQVAMDTEGDVTVGGPAVLHALGIRDGAAERALARGETVLFDRRYDDHGSLRLRLITDMAKQQTDDRTPSGEVRTVPVHVAGERTPYGLVAVMPRQAALAAGFRTVPFGSYYTTSRMPSGAQQQALAGALANFGSDAETYLEKGYQSKNHLVLLALSIFAGLVTVGAAGIATGLAQADAEPDLKTLAAIGAAPGVRRRLSGFQCGLIAAMGVVLGSLAGVLPAIGLRRAQLREEWSTYHTAVDNGWGRADSLPHVPIVVPWGTLVLLMLAVPLGATLLAAAVTRARPQLTRRADG